MNRPEDEMLLAGKITGAYGIKGWVKLHVLTDQPDNFFAFSRWQVMRRGVPQPIVFEDGRVQGKGMIAKVAGVDSRTDAELLRGLEVWVPAEELPELEAGDYYWHELEGMQVVSEHEGRSVLLGEVDHLLETGANDVLVLRACAGSTDKRERLIPYLPGDVVLEVDREAHRMRVNWHPDD